MAIWHQPVPDLVRLSALQEGTMAGHLGITVTAITDETLTARMPVDHRTLQPHGRLHGGASVALAETVGSIAANLTLDSTTQIWSIRIADELDRLVCLSRFTVAVIPAGKA